MKTKAKPSIGICENPYCEDLAIVTLVNGDERTKYCDMCFRESAGEIVAENDGLITFCWNADHTVCTL